MNFFLKSHYLYSLQHQSTLHNLFVTVVAVFPKNGRLTVLPYSIPLQMSFSMFHTARWTVRIFRLFICKVTELLSCSLRMCYLRVLKHFTVDRGSTFSPAGHLTLHHACDFFSLSLLKKNWLLIFVINPLDLISE